MLAQSLVPLVIGAVVDGPIRHHDSSGLWALVGLALALGIAEGVLFYCRRIAMSKASLGIESDLRRDLFAPSAAPAGVLSRPVAVRPAAVADDQ